MNADEPEATTVRRLEFTAAYFPALGTVSQRNGDCITPFACLQNLDRVRGVVR